MFAQIILYYHTCQPLCILRRSSANRCTLVWVITQKYAEVFFFPLEYKTGDSRHQSGMICVGVLHSLILTENWKYPLPLSPALSLSVEVNRERFEFINVK